MCMCTYMYTYKSKYVIDMYIYITYTPNEECLTIVHSLTPSFHMKFFPSDGDQPAIPNLWKPPCMYVKS